MVSPSIPTASGPPPVPGFAPGTGRERPAHQPRRIECPSCGQGLELRDEHSRLVICRACGRHLELSQAEARVLSKRAGGGPGSCFQLSLGDRFRYRGVPYEVIGRLRYDEEEVFAPTCQYLLFHPRRGTLWLSEYMGHWDVSHTSRVMPESDPRELKKGDWLRTHDDHEWLLAGKGTYQLGWVDGALPWLARVGNQVDYAELVAADGSGETYEVEHTRTRGSAGGGREMETARGRLLTLDEVREATDRQIMSPSGPRENVLDVSTDYRQMKRVAIVFLLVNLVLLIFFAGKGREVLQQKFTAEELTGEVLSEPFELESSALYYELRAPLQNAWMAVDLALVLDVHGDSEVVRVTQDNISYYSGRSEGESWSEGSKRSTNHLAVDQPGTYRLLLRAVSGSGDQPSSTVSELPLEVKVLDGAHPARWLVLSNLLVLVSLIVVAARHHQWRTADDEDWDEDGD